MASAQAASSSLPSMTGAWPALIACATGRGVVELIWEADEVAAVARAAAHAKMSRGMEPLRYPRRSWIDLRAARPHDCQSPPLIRTEQLMAQLAILLLLGLGLAGSSLAQSK